MQRTEEQDPIVAGQQINYDGVFSYRRLFQFIEEFIRSRGYSKKVLTDLEKVTEKGKNITLVMRPYKNVKEDIAVELRLKLTIQNMTDIEKEIDGLKVSLNRAKINAVVDGYLITNFRGKWEARAEYTFIRTFFDSFLYKSAGDAKYEKIIKKDAMDFADELHSLLHLNKFLF